VVAARSNAIAHESSAIVTTEVMTARNTPMKRSKTLPELGFPLALGLEMAVFVIDLLTPLGTGEWVLYLLPLLLASRSARKSQLIYLSLASTAFIILGLLWSPAGVPSNLAIMSRFLGTFVLWVTTVLVVQRRGVEQALRDSEESFRLLFVNNPLPIWVYDPDTLAFLEVNEAAVTHYGYSRDELLRMRVTDISLTHDLPQQPENFSGMPAHLRDVGELQHRRKSGEIIEVRMVCGRVRFAGREAVLATIQDLSERKRAEQEQARLQAALRRSELMSALGSLVAGVAHEVRNPLFAISATLDAFEARFGREAEYRAYFRVLRAELGRVNQLTRDLLEYGKPQALALAPGAIEQVVAEAVNACAAQAKQGDVHVTLHVREGLSALRMDWQRLRQVFENVLQNAIQHSPRGGVVLVETDEVGQDGRTWVQCAVTDPGSGFRPEDLPRVFDPFFTRRQGGTGLGLSIAQRIVEEHGGTISAHNHAAGGARVEVRLPAAAR
jgi:PAS domain S-box-containing protein